MLRKLIILSSLLLILSAGAIVASAQEWENLGAKEVKDRSEQDTWHLSGDGQFRRLKIAVEQRAVRFYRLRVTFGNGRTQEFSIRSLIPAGRETRALDLKGRNRNISKVDIWYEAYTARRGVRAQVTLYGLK